MLSVLGGNDSYLDIANLHGKMVDKPGLVSYSTGVQNAEVILNCVEKIRAVNDSVVKLNFSLLNSELPLATVETKIVILAKRLVGKETKSRAYL